MEKKIAPDDMWRAYLKERIDAEVYQTDYGFVCYTDHPETDSLYIRDVYVVPEFRKDPRTILGITEIFNRARELGRKMVTGFIASENKTYQRSLKNQLNFGFKIRAVHEGNVYTYCSVEDFFLNLEKMREEKAQGDN